MMSDEKLKKHDEDIHKLNKKLEQIEKDVYKVKADQRLTEQSVQYLIENFGALKLYLESQLNKIDDRLEKQDVDRTERQKTELDNIKKMLWKFGVGIVTAIVVFVLGIQ